MKAVFIFLAVFMTASHARYFKPSGELLLDGSCQQRETQRIKNCMGMGMGMHQMPHASHMKVKKWLFNSEKGKCESFQASFYCGNKHGFDTKHECINSCACEIPPHPGTENGANCKPETRYSYDQRAEMCRAFQYTGCGGNGNNFKTQSQCMSQCNPRDLGSSDFFHMMNMMGMANGGFGFGNRVNSFNTPPPPPRHQNSFNNPPSRNRNNFGPRRPNRFGRRRQQNRPFWGQNRRQQNRKPQNPLRDILPPGRW